MEPQTKMVNRQKGNISLAILILLGVVLFLAGFVVAKFTTNRVDAAATIIDGASSADPTKDHFVLIDGALNSTGTTTLSSKSPDGFIAWASFTVATGTNKAVFTNTGGPIMCGDESGMAYFKTNGFTPGLVVAIGTSTSATAYSANLLASTTVATTTAATGQAQVVDVTYAAPFAVNSGESIVASLSDQVSNASTTYFSRFTSAEIGFQCWALGQ